MQNREVQCSSAYIWRNDHFYDFLQIIYHRKALQVAFLSYGCISALSYVGAIKMFAVENVSLRFHFNPGVWSHLMQITYITRKKYIPLILHM